MTRIYVWTFSAGYVLTIYDNGPHGICAVIPGHSAQAHMDSTNTEMRFTFYRRASSASRRAKR